MKCKNCGKDLESERNELCLLCEEERKLLHIDKTNDISNKEEEREELFINNIMIEEAESFSKNAHNLENEDGSSQRNNEQKKEDEDKIEREVKEPDVDVDKNLALDEEEDLFKTFENQDGKTGYLGKKLKSFSNLSAQYEDDEMFVPDIEVKREKKNKKIKKVGVIIGAIVLLFSFLYVTGIIENINSPRRIYIRTERNNLMNIASRGSDFFEELKSESLAFAKLPYEHELHMGIELEGNYIEPFEDVLGLVDGIKLNKNTFGDNENRKYYIDYNVLAEERDFFNAKVYQDDRLFWITFPGIRDTKYRVDISDLRRFLWRFPVTLDYVPQKVYSKKEYVEIFDFASTREVYRILNRYNSIYFNSFSNKNIVVEKDVEKEFAGRRGNYKRIIVRLSRNEIQELFENFFKTLQNDQQVFDVLNESLKTVMMYDGNFGEEEEGEFSFEFYQEVVRYTYEYLRENYFEADMEMTMFVDDKSNIVSRKIEFFDRFEESEVRNEIKLDNLTYDDGSVYNYLDVRIGDIETNIYLISDEQQNDENDSEKKYTFRMDYKDNYPEPIPLWPFVVEYNVKSRYEESVNIRDRFIGITLADKRDDLTKFLITTNSVTRLDDDILVPKFEGDVFDLNEERVDSVLVEVLNLLQDIAKFMGT